MPDMEKVIKGLQNLRDAIATDYIHDADQAVGTIDNAIALLKEQEAKLLTFEEVEKHYSIPRDLLRNIWEYADYANDIEPLYLECPDDDGFVLHWRTYDSISMRLDGWKKDYGKTWRCWTKKPTLVQRQAVIWNDNQRDKDK